MKKTTFDCNQVMIKIYFLHLLFQASDEKISDRPLNDVMKYVRKKICNVKI